ncbi:MlaE family ABC transporter permease [Mesoterricola sediminis]|uniref:ABC transporter permease n=1 Tax=Mesoterricola sediminis TaxID=2927980 RepID=A0AA48H3K6_9BACT|nr:ABC transporter permease [Mesoterricola sediminis]BDU76831.1 ABC transporter permease [Mesoterricola sediminis]
MISKLLEQIGTRVLAWLEQAGDLVTLSGRTFVGVFRRPFDGANLLHQLQAVGVNSVPVVVLTSLAVSMVFAVQLAFGFKQFQAEGLAGQVEGLAVVRELAPVITGLMMAGRVGSAMAAELGTMQVTEQIDALECLATDPIHYLFVPRLLASLIMLPLLTAISIYVGYLGGYVLLVLVQGHSAWVYSQDFFKLIKGRDLLIALTKGLSFGLIIAMVGCWRGYRTRGGAEGVGNAPTSSVVTSSLWILVTDFFLTKLLLV